MPKTAPMKVVILAGGYGARLAEETDRKPKPMVEVGGRPLLWHIMTHYARAGFKEFVVALGYRGDVIKRYFMNYYTLQGNLTVNLGTGKILVENRKRDDWSVQLIDTGEDVMTGGRLLRLRPLLKDAPFLLTYGDGLSNVDLRKLIDHHRKAKCAVTLTSVRPPARFGGIEFDGDRVVRFSEKPQIGEGWINGGFMAMEPEVFKYLKDDRTILEKDVLERLAKERKLSGYRHEGFWLGCDTLRDLRVLESLWKSGHPPWIENKK